MFGKITILQNSNQQRLPISAPIVFEKSKYIHKNKKQKGRTVGTRNKVEIYHRTANQLKGSKFRIINEILYTKSSEESVRYFKQNKEDFQIYHEGFKTQTDKWSENPLHSIINYLKKHHANKGRLILDLGCGEGQLHESMSNVARVRSFDLVSKKQFVEVADIAKLPVSNRSVDICVFCLSLMGTNYINFLQEARRVLKSNGELLIAEVESRCKQWNNFIKMIQSLGFQCRKNSSNKYFRLLFFSSNLNKAKQLVIEGQRVDIEQYSKSILHSCQYKKR